MTPPELLALHSVARSLPQSANVLEIGSYLGASACFICSGMMRRGEGRLICIDTWGNDAMRYTDEDTDADPRETWNEFACNTKKYSHMIVPLRGYSHELTDSVIGVSPVLDFLFIDGDHSYVAVKRDWDSYSPLLRVGSVVAFHDVGWAEGVQRVIAEDVAPYANIVSRLPNLVVFQLTAAPWQD